jgi:hypothetical protein
MSTNTTYAEVAAGVQAAIAAYTHALDDGCPDDVVATFCADGAIDIPGTGAHQGHDALLAAYSRFTPTTPTRHLVLNTHITDWRDAEASAVSDVVFIVMGESGWKIQLVGRSPDTLHHDDGTWRFHRRVAEFVT